jgi:hypothetical protein
MQAHTEHAFTGSGWTIHETLLPSTRPSDCYERLGRGLMGQLFAPEFRLTAACAMWPPSDHRTEAIRNAVAGPFDWPRFLRVAKRHQVIGLVRDGLTRAGIDVPPKVAQEIGTDAETLTIENLAMARESLRIQHLFDEAHLPVLFVKGATLAVLAFGDIGLRASEDIDLLVTRETLPAATALLLRAGYRRYNPPPNIGDSQLRLMMPLRKDFGFVHEATGFRVELHWRLFLNRFAMTETSIMAASRIVSLTGVEGVRTLGEEDLFSYLCMHGALHWWNRVKWIADINALLASIPEDGVKRLVHAAEARGAGRAATQALILCRTLLKTPLPTSLNAMLDKSITMRWLETTALKTMTTGRGEHDPHEVPFGTTRGSISTVLLSRSWRYKLAELHIQLTNPTDVLTLPLPQPMRFLYPVLRLPLWAWRHTVQHNDRRHKTHRRRTLLE